MVRACGPGGGGPGISAINGCPGNSIVVCSSLIVLVIRLFVAFTILILNILVYKQIS